MAPAPVPTPPERNPNYVRAMDAKVLKAFGAPGGAEAPWLVLDRTAFYAEGGGQPSDVGKLVWDGGEARVTHVSKKGAVKHEVAGDMPPQGVALHGEIDWDLRYKHMRMHTAQHLVSAVVWSRWQGRTVGNQLHADRSRIDFEPLKVDDATLADLENAVNEVAGRDVAIVTYEADRADVERKAGARSLLHLVPQSVRRLRVVEIGSDIDYCPCAGTHVASTKEIRGVRFLGREGKGADKVRVEYELR